ncbi:MAG: hypothetical protein RL613_225 [Fusobacteriota bacterium]|jgi:predicted  nucleic acid-binding Zn-ribbon protein
MANANAIKIRSTKKTKTGKPKYPKPSGANLAHNSAVNKANYWLNDGGDIIQSQSYNNTHEVNADWIKWENEAKERYKNNPSNQRAIKSNAILLEEGLIIIGTDVNAKDKDIEKIAKDFVAKFEKDNNTNIRHWAYHNHEGHKEDGKEHINRHIHFIFDNVDNNGVMVRRNWKRDYFKQMQTDIFDISKKYVKDIERGKESEYEEVEIEDRIVKINTRKQIHHRVFRKMKENEQIEDLSQEKTILKKENTSLKGQVTKNKNEKEKLKEANKALEMQLKELNIQLQSQLSNREQHAQREALVKELKEELKNKTLTTETMQSKFAELEEKLLKEKSHLNSIIAVKEIENLDLNTQNKSLQEQKEVLASKVTTLEQKIVSSSNIVPQKEISEELQKIITEEFTKKEILESRMGKATPAIIVKEPDSFLKRIQKLTSQGVQSVANTLDSLKKEINEWKEKYNSLLEVLNSKNQKIADLEEKLQTISTKQQNQTQTKNHLEAIVEKFEAHKGEKSDSSNLEEKKEVQEEEIKGKIRRDR